MAHARGYLSGAGFPPALRWMASWKPALLAACLGVAHSVFGQPPQQTVRFAVFSAQPISGLTFSPRPNAAAQKIVFYPTARSPRYDYRGAMPLRFVDETTGEVVAEASIPAEIREPLLLFSAVQNTGKMPVPLKYQIAVLDDSATRLAPGALAIINLSGLALSGTIGRETVTLKAGLNPPLAIGRAAKIELRTKFKNRTYQSYANTVQLTPRQRALLVLFPPFNAGSLEVQSRLLIDEPGAQKK